MPASILTVGPFTVSGIAVQPLAASGISHIAGFSPSQFTGLVGWFDATQITGISSGASLSTWTDSSGTGNHLSMVSAARQPVYVQNAQNGLPAVRFWSGAASSLLTSSFTLAQPTTVFMTFSMTSTIAAQQDLCDGNAGATMLLFTPSVLPSHFEAFAGNAVDSLQTISRTSWYVGGAAFSASSSSIYIASSSSFGNVSASTPAGFILGGRVNFTNSLVGDIGEAALYNRVLTVTELSQLTGYLISKWSTF